MHSTLAHPALARPTASDFQHLLEQLRAAQAALRDAEGDDDIRSAAISEMDASAALLSLIQSRAGDAPSAVQLADGTIVAAVPDPESNNPDHGTILGIIAGAKIARV